MFCDQLQIPYSCSICIVFHNVPCAEKSILFVKCFLDSNICMCGGSKWSNNVGLILKNNRTTENQNCCETFNESQKHQNAVRMHDLYNIAPQLFIFQCATISDDVMCSLLRWNMLIHSDINHFPKKKTDANISCQLAQFSTWPTWLCPDD